MPDRNHNLRFTLKHLFLLVTLFAAALFVGRAAGSVALSIHLLLLILGWAFHRFLQASLAGLIPCLLGFDYLVIRGIGWIHLGDEGPFIFDGVFNTVATSLVVIGVLIFLHLATRKQPAARWQ